MGILQTLACMEGTYPAAKRLRLRLELKQPFSLDYAAGTIEQLGRLLEQTAKARLRRTNTMTAALESTHDIHDLCVPLGLPKQWRPIADRMALAYAATSYGKRTSWIQPGRCDEILNFLGRCDQDLSEELFQKFIGPSVFLAKKLVGKPPRRAGARSRLKLSHEGKRLWGKQLRTNPSIARSLALVNTLLATGGNPDRDRALAHVREALLRITTKWQEDSLLDLHRSTTGLLDRVEIALKEVCVAALAHRGANLQQLSTGGRPLRYEHNIPALLAELGITPRGDLNWMAWAHHNITQGSGSGPLSRLLRRIKGTAAAMSKVRQKGDLRQPGRPGTLEKNARALVTRVRRDYCTPALNTLEKVLQEGFASHSLS